MKSYSHAAIAIRPRPTPTPDTSRLTARKGFWALLCVFAGAMGTCAAPPRTLDTFRYSSAQAAEMWRAQGASPPPRPVHEPEEGLEFVCPFDRLEEDRFYWDRQVSMDLSGYTSLELELSCEVPSAFRSLAVYLESGDGWFVWNRPLPRAGRQRLVMRRHEFSSEGRPAGWHRITRIRLSPWRGERRGVTLRLYALRARHDVLVLIRGTTSVPPGERSIAAATAERVGRWLNAIGASYARLDDEDVTDKNLQDIRAAILPYNPKPSDAMVERLKAFLKQGGKLLVFYGADARLAEAMGFRLGPWKLADPSMRWASFRFVEPDTWGVPPRVFQTSGNLLPVYPVREDTATIAIWEDEQGRPTEDPAIVAGNRGAWMSHILLPDDAVNKQWVLAALLVRYAPDLAPEIADTCIEASGRIDSFSSLTEASRVIGAAASTARDPRRVEARLGEARQRNDRLRGWREQARYVELLAESRRLRETVTEAYALVQRPVRNEWRGAWDHRGLGWYPGDWDRTCREMKAAGLNVIFINALWAGQAHYPSAIVPGSDTLRLYGDQLAACLEAAEKHGLRVHLWYVCWNLSGAPDDWRRQMTDERRIQSDASGRAIPWLNPADPRNTDFALRAIREAAQRYPVHGVHLDYIRWPETEADFSAVSRAAFEQAIGTRGLRWPADVRPGGARHEAWLAWRAEVISDFVRRSRETLRAARPEAQLSAAVWGNYPECARSVGQDWGLWLRRGWVDFVVPMNYTENLNAFTALCRRQMALPAADGRLFPGIGVTAGESSLGPDQVIEQIVVARRLGAKGFALFQMDAELRDRVLPMLRLGLTAPLADGGGIPVPNGLAPRD